MSRESKKLLSNVSRETAEYAFADYNKAVSNLQIIEGRMNAEITAVKEKWESKINTNQAAKDVSFVVLQTYAEENADLFTEKKSIDWVHGTFGFRTGMPKLITRKGFKWPAVLELVKSKFPQYIRTKEELDKESLMANRLDLDLKEVGCEVAQDESFYVVPNLESVSA